MALMPGVTHQLVSGLPNMTRWDILCFHTIVGYDTSAAHFSVMNSGQIKQTRDTIKQSAANYQGNHRVIAVETADHGPQFGSWDTNNGHAVPAWTDAQCWSNAHIAVFAHKAHGIPLVMAPDSKPTSRGVAYHRMGINSPNNFAGYRYKGRVSGGEVWSKSAGKVCPGDRRITQLIEVVLPRARVLAGLDKPKEIGMELGDRIEAWHGGEVTVGEAIGNIYQWTANLAGGEAYEGKGIDEVPWVKELRETLTELKADVRDIKARLDAQQT